MDRRVTPPKQVTLPICGLQPPNKQALINFSIIVFHQIVNMNITGSKHVSMGLCGNLTKAV